MRKALVVIFTASTMAFTLAAGARADDQADRLAAAKEVLAVTHSLDRMQILLPLIFKQLRGMLVQANPNVGKELETMIPRFEEKAKARSAELTPIIAELYAKRFTAAELHELVAFWKTPLGQKFAAEQASISVEAMELGKQWGQKVAQETLEEIKGELRKKGYEL